MAEPAVGATPRQEAALNIMGQTEPADVADLTRVETALCRRSLPGYLD
jgi:hypothetical protein